MKYGYPAAWFVVLALSAMPQTDNDTLARQAVEAERRGDFAGAASAFLTLLRNGADSPELRNNLGIAYFEMHQFRRALEQFQTALKKNPDSATANLFAGLSSLSLQRPEQALPYLQRAYRAQPANVAVVLALSRAEIASNHLGLSRNYYTQAVRMDPHNAEGWYGLGITNRILAEQELKHSADKAKALLDASTQAMDHAMQLDPGSVQAHMVLGESFRIAERYDLAIKEYKAATETQPNLSPAWDGLAAAYSASGDDGSALQAASRAVDLDANNADADSLIAGICLRMGDYAKAEPYAVRALQLQPDLASAHTVLAKIYLAKQQPERALPELQSAAKEDRDGTVYYLLSTTLKQLGRTADAATAMQKYKQLHNAHAAATPGG